MMAGILVVDEWEIRRRTWASIFRQSLNRPSQQIAIALTPAQSRVLAVDQWGNSGKTSKCGCEMRLLSKTGFERNVGERLLCQGQALAGELDAKRTDEGTNRHAPISAEPARNPARTYSNPPLTPPPRQPVTLICFLKHFP